MSSVIVASLGLVSLADTTTNQERPKEEVVSNLSVVRVAGTNRYETSYKISEELGEYKNIVIASGEDFPDALAATPFLYQNNNDKNNTRMPITLAWNPRVKVDSEILQIVFGGESFLPKGNEKLRLAGSNRYKTSVEVAKAFKTVLNKDIDTVIIASGEDYPDALSAGPLASSKNAAILLTEAKGLNPDVKKYIEETKSIKNVIIVGGESTVSAQVEKDLATIAR